MGKSYLEEKGKEEFIKIFIFFLSILLPTMLVPLLIPSTITRDDNAIIEKFVMSIDAFVADSYEFKRFSLYIISMLIVATLSTYFINKYKHKLSFSVAKKGSIIIIITFFVYITSFIILKKSGLFYYMKYWSITLAPLESILLILVIPIVFFLYKKFLSKQNAMAFIIDCLALIFILYAATFCFNTNMSISFYVHHFSAIYDGIYGIFQGQTIGVNMLSLYGLYPYVIFLISKLFFKTVTVETTLLILFFLNMLINACIYFSVLNITKRRSISILVLFSTIWFTQIAPTIKDSSPYLQYFPIRVLFPAICLFLATVYNKNDINNLTKKVIRVFLVLLSILSLFWNLETGIICVLSTLGMLLLELINEFSLTSSKFWKTTTLYLLVFVSLILILYGILQIFTFHRSGEYASIEKLLFGIIAFAGYGFYMLIIPEDSPYFISIILYSIAIVYPITNIKSWGSKGIKNKQLSMFFAGVTGFGAFAYFLGRSHEDTFFVSVWPIFIVAGLFLDSFLDIKAFSSKTIKNLFSLSAVLVSLVLISCSISPFLIKKHEKYNEYIENAKTPYTLPLDSDIVAKNKSEHMAIIHLYSPVLASENQIKNEYLGPTLTNWYFYEDYYDFADFLSTYKGTVIINNHLINNETKKSYLILIQDILEKNFTLVDASKGASCFIFNG